MTDNAKLVLNGFLKLTTSEQSEVVDEINYYYKADETKKRTMCESLKKIRAGVILGPTSGSCPCCGR
jgi:hypothetical protein